MIYHLTKAFGDISITINTNGSYEIHVNNKTWLQSTQKVFLKANGFLYTNSDKTLSLNATSASSGTDEVLGEWDRTTFDYTLYDDAKTLMQCSITTYDSQDLIRFTQVCVKLGTFPPYTLISKEFNYKYLIKKFPNGAKRTRSDDFDSVLSAFPSFDVKRPEIGYTDIGFLSFGGMMAGDMEKTFGTWNAISYTNDIQDGLAGGPLILFQPSGDTLVISQMTQFMSTSMQHERYFGGYLNFGVMSGVDTIPENFSADFLVYYSQKGINKVKCLVVTISRG
jgi:hypothetical protein